MESTKQAQQLRHDALAIWQAGVAAVTPSRLFQDKVSLHGSCLSVEDRDVDLAQAKRLVIVGAGKAAASMAVALHRHVLSKLPDVLPHLEISGWINAPAGSFSASQMSEVAPIHLHAARPAGANLPTELAVEGTRRILDIVGDCDRSDVVVCLLSGGGSALLVAPRAGISLADKQAVAREMAAAGGNIEQLNAVRRALSCVKGGGLARACQAGRLITLIVSDVIGDPLQTIASGPTVYDASVAPLVALNALEQLGLVHAPRLANVVRTLEQDCASAVDRRVEPENQAGCRVEHIILGNNADAIDAAGVKAVELGYRYVMQGASAVEGDVLDVAKSATQAIQQLMAQDQIDCWISGGEPTVTLPRQGGGRGGRNQQLALAVLSQLQQCGWPERSSPMSRELVFLSGGTDGEDGPTDAAGAWIDAGIAQSSTSLKLGLHDYLQRADAYSFFEQVGGLIVTGPTGTNVCDLRVALSAKNSRGH